MISVYLLLDCDKVWEDILFLPNHPIISVYFYNINISVCSPSLYPLLFFPAHGKILAWAGRKKYPGREGYLKENLGEMEVSLKKSWFNVIVEK